MTDGFITADLCLILLVYFGAAGLDIIGGDFAAAVIIDRA